uniref:ATP synthase complex subunit 8 n=1 Tax=Calotomus carolinus TaxID=188112 RepID=Q0ZYX5_CALCR|nr:ATPase subunit 8 [Calotomus carolinus]ABA11030.1 ATPase subunit 8 [Calotomus carolinus]ABA11032.1 ATPase subunit 8 [Calotomus carolinus]ABA11034.1 ATPase subunit 8 [Calotomus carolinus]ABA11036.1 ATPase subunit 8 [Calotomus carolinus]
MPQLNPYPWLKIMVYTWMLLMIILPPKVISFLYSKDPITKKSKEPKGPPWSWPWH